MSIAALAALTVIACAPPPDPGAAVAEATARLAAQERFTSEKIGAGGEASPSYRAFADLMRVADDADLLDLLTHASPVVRLYAASGLIQRGHGAEGVIVRIADPNQPVETQSGCFVWRTTVGEAARALEGDLRIFPPTE